MRKLALSDEILMQIEKPARYIGNELNSVVKDDTSQIRFAMCFPDVYEIGMSHLGIQILYDMFNRREDTWCERVYSPWPDLHKIMKEQNIPLFGLESQEPIKNFDFVGLTLQYEMCYTNILQILDLAQIPLLSADRGDEDPIILGGGPCSYNPEPIADFFDCFYIGEGETQYDTFLNLYKSMRASGQYSRKAFLHEAAKIEGIYVPSLYEVRYKEDGTIAAFTPVYDDIPATIKKQVDMDLTGSVYPEKPVVPFIKATQDRVVLEIQRGCIRGCRFCQAGMIYRPNREKGAREDEKEFRLCDFPRVVGGAALSRFARASGEILGNFSGLGVGLVRVQCSQEALGEDEEREGRIKEDLQRVRGEGHGGNQMKGEGNENELL